MRKGIILAGGAGTRLYPLTRSVSKQLMPVYDKPMIYYPLTTLMLAGIRDMLIITTPEDSDAFKRLLGNGHDWGINLNYAVQQRPEGIAQALLIGKRYIDGSNVALILGDNIFYGHQLGEILQLATQRSSGASIFGYQVSNPERYGVVTFDPQLKPVDIEEKPTHAASAYAVTGLYFYDSDAVEIAASIKPSSRGELEITDVNRAYLERGDLTVELLGRGIAWLDTGTHEDLLSASNFIAVIESRQGLKIACPEEIAYRMGFIDSSQLEYLAGPLIASGYGQYLLDLIDQGKQG